MDEYAAQLVRLADLMSVGAGILRDLRAAQGIDRESSDLDAIAVELDRLSVRVKTIGCSGSSS